MNKSQWGVFTTRDEVLEMIPGIDEDTIYPIFVMFFETGECAIFNRDQFGQMISLYLFKLAEFHDKITGQNTLLPFNTPIPKTEQDENAGS